jgi:hypothetical protein
MCVICLMEINVSVQGPCHFWRVAWAGRAAPFVADAASVMVDAACVSYEEEDTCVSYEEEDTCVSYAPYSNLSWLMLHVCHMRGRIHVYHMPHIATCRG